METIVEVERGTQDELRQDLKSLFQGAIRVTLGAFTGSWE